MVSRAPQPRSLPLKERKLPVLARCRQAQTLPRQNRDRYRAQVLAQPLDVSDAEAVDAFVKHVAHEFGGVDVCVTNAGGPPAKMFMATTTAESGIVRWSSTS